MVVFSKQSLYKIRTLLFFLIILTQSCEKKESWDNIKFVDNTNNVNLRLLYLKPICYDSLLPLASPYFSTKSPSEEGQPFPVFNTLECDLLSKCINNSPQKALTFFVFHKDTLLNNPWDSVVKHKKYIKRYIITSSEIAGKENYTIVYP